MAIEIIPCQVGSAECPGGPGQDQLLRREAGKKIGEAICKRLVALKPNNVLEISFEKIKAIDFSCADELVAQVLARLDAGDLPDRFVILSHVSDQHRENIDAALRLAKKVIIIKEKEDKQKKEGWSLAGGLDHESKKVLARVMEAGLLTAKELQERMKYYSINEASARLTFLYQHYLIAREPFRMAVRGGGRQFRYLSLVA
jgi:hypothetical protein